MYLGRKGNGSIGSKKTFVRSGITMHRFIFSAVAGFALSATMAATAAPALRSISLNCQHTGAMFHSPLNVCIGGDHAANELHPEVFRQMAIAHRQCGISYIRFHGLLDDDMHVVRRAADGRMVYNWKKIDRLYSGILHAGLKPLVELSFMPDALASGKATIFYYRGDITPPAHYKQWGQLIHALARHLEKRFGRREVRSWYFEVWNEPNGMLHTGGFKAYFKMFAAADRAIKSVDPQLRVGGPATAGMAWISRFIAACHKQHLPVNFISTHTYGGGPHKWPGKKREGLRVAGNPRAIAGGIDWTKKRIAKSAMPRLPLIITEWGPSYSARDAVHDTYFQAVWLIEQVHAMKHPPAIMSYWALSDIFEEDGPLMNPFEGSFGIFNPEGIEKPTFFALKYLHELQGPLINTHNAHSIAVAQHGGVALLAWNYHWPKQTMRDDDFFSALRPSASARTIALNISHLHPGKYRLQVYAEGYSHNDAYTLYQHWGRPDKLSAKQLKLLRRATENRPLVNTTASIAAKGNWKYQLPMRTNRVLLLKLSREGQ